MALTIVSVMAVALFVTLASAVPPPPDFTKCDKLPKIATDSAKALEPYGIEWRLFKSLRPSESCVRFQYTSDPSDSTKAVGTLWSRLLGNFSANIVIAGGNEWDVYNNFDGRTAMFYTLNYDPNLNFWCVYTCEDDGKLIEDIRCFALNKEGKAALDADLASMEKLPIKRGERLLDVYDDKCDVKV